MSNGELLIKRLGENEYEVTHKNGKFLSNVLKER
jgi:hypothetical protein